MLRSKYEDKILTSSSSLWVARQSTRWWFPNFSARIEHKNMFPSLCALSCKVNYSPIWAVSASLFYLQELSLCRLQVRRTRKIVLILLARRTAGIKKSLNAASKGQDCGALALWAQPASNHMYWCAAASRGNGDLLVDAWTSLTRHVINVHKDHPGMYTRCFHAPIEEGEWMEPGKEAVHIPNQTYFFVHIWCLLLCRLVRHISIGNVDL